MARISFDNGHTFYDPSDLVPTGPVNPCDYITLEALVPFMDDDVCERLHSVGFFPGSEELFIRAYLIYADDDLIVG